MTIQQGGCKRIIGGILAAAALWGGAFAQAGTIGGTVADWTRWVEVEGLPIERNNMVAGSLNGELVAAGGLGNGYPYTRTNTYRYDGASWAEVAGMPVPLGESGSGVYSGMVYAVGGSAGTAYFSTNVLRYNGTSWAAAPAFPVAASGVGVGILGGNLYAVGASVSYNSTTNVFRFNGTSWAAVAALPQPRSGMAVATLGTNLFAVGGYGVDYESFSTNAYRYNGTSWTQVKGLPKPMGYTRGAVLDGKMYVVGGATLGFENCTNVYRFDGTNWTEVAGLPEERSSVALAVHNDTLYSIGGSTGEGSPATNVFVYPWRTPYGGVDPEAGSVDGGFTVTITGTDLSDGTLGDVTNVTLCGVAATPVAVNGTTQIVVTAGASGASGLGTVRVQSASRGLSEKEDGFTYEGTSRVVLYDLFLREEGGVVRVCWQTASEEGTVGFDLYRWDGDGWTKVNESPILAHGEMGSSYAVADAAANAEDTFRYKLVEIETGGGVQEYGPFDVAAWRPRLQNVGVGEKGIMLRWRSREGETYEVRRLTSLMAPPATIAVGLPATPPVNEFVDEEKAEGAGFYQIRVEQDAAE